MKYAVVRTQGHQYKVAEGEDFLVPLVDGELEHDVLLVVNDETVMIGDPVVKNAKVSLKIIDPLVKGEKVHVFKYKAKSRYRKSIGSRPKYSRVLVEKIG